MKTNLTPLQMFEIAIDCWKRILLNPKLRMFLNLQIDIDKTDFSKMHTTKAQFIEDAATILADERMDRYMKHPWRLTVLQRAANS